MDVPENMLYAGVAVDIVFGSKGPSFGDLFQVIGQTHPAFPPSGSFDFQRFSDLQFDQVDDYFGVPSLAEDGDDVVIWLYPLVKGRPVDHHPGPFDGIRLSFCVLRNPVRHAEYFLRGVERFARLAPRVFYRSRHMDLGSPPNLDVVRSDIESIAQTWRDRGIEVGSEEALRIDF